MSASPPHRAGPLRRLARDEEGASLVFAAITLFALTTSILFVFQVGMVSADRLQVQTAADAAAYSAAQVEANALNAIAQINDGMAYLNYTLLRHTADAVVYGTLNEFRRRPPEPMGQYSWVFMGGPNEASLQGGGGRSGYEGWLRIEHTINRLNETLPKGKRWLTDLHYAGRMILAATPQLARDAACRVAALNGASHVAFSEDLELAFRVGGEGAFLEAGGAAAGRPFHESMYERYGRQKTPEVEDLTGGGAGKLPSVARGLPAGSWWESSRGGLTGDYSQVRICWNDRDWDHRPGLTDHQESPFDAFRRGPPNGHWHWEHGHMWMEEITLPDGTTMKVPRYKEHRGKVGNDPLGGHWDDDVPLHEKSKSKEGDLAQSSNPEHHWAVRCPTCEPQRSKQEGRDFSSIKVNSGSVGGGLRRVFQLRFESGFMPKPLRVEADLFRHGVTVVAWREGRALGSLFPASEWGMISVATAQVGYQTDEGVLPLDRIAGDGAAFGGETVPVARRQGGDPEYRNLFYSADASRGVRFGARLAPIGRGLSWNVDLADGSGLAALLSDGDRWYQVAPGRSPQRGAPAQMSGGGFDALKGFVSAEPSADGLEAFWH